MTTQFSHSGSRHKGHLCKLDRLGALKYYLLFTQLIPVDNNRGLSAGHSVWVSVRMWGCVCGHAGLGVCGHGGLGCVDMWVWGCVDMRVGGGGLGMRVWGVWVWVCGPGGGVWTHKGGVWGDYEVDHYRVLVPRSSCHSSTGGQVNNSSVTLEFY